LNWRQKADEVERPFLAPIRAKNLLDRPRPRVVPAGFSIRFAPVRSSPQRFDSVLSIVVWCGVLPHHHISIHGGPKMAIILNKNKDYGHFHVQGLPVLGPVLNFV
jgi:hypothetical protein